MSLDLVRLSKGKKSSTETGYRPARLDHTAGARNRRNEGRYGRCG